MPHFAFGGQDFQICGKTALFWPGRSALIVADLHLEKASWFAARGQMLPPYDSFATLERLAGLLAQTAPRCGRTRPIGRGCVRSARAIDHKL
jgi:uncharacterized protein